jgi:6-phosphogluconolactonase
MHSWKRPARLVLVTATIVLASLARNVPAALAADSYSGQWNVLEVVQCNSAIAGNDLCAKLLGPGGASSLVRGAQITCSDAAHCTYQSYVVGRNVAGNANPSCSPEPIGIPFTAGCRETETGTMVVQPGPYGQDFFITGETANFYGPTSSNSVLGVHDPGGAGRYPLDTGIPAVPGVYNTAENLAVGGLLMAGSTAPAGVTFEIAVSHASPGATGTSALALPVLSAQGQGLSAGFIVSWFSAAPGVGQVQFGSGPGCLGLTSVGTNDLFPGFSAHSVLVTGNELQGKSIGASAVLPGQTYSYQVATISGSTVITDNNGGACNSVSIPTSLTPAATANDTGAVFVETNQKSGNSILEYRRSADGTLSSPVSYPTGGVGTGLFLDTSGAVILNQSNTCLYAVNAGSNTVTSFRRAGPTLAPANTVPSAGAVPVSLTTSGTLLYVLNQATRSLGASSISGFTVDAGCHMSPLAGSTRPVLGAAPAQIGFNRAGTVLVVSDRETPNTVPSANGLGSFDTYTVGADGLPSAPKANDSTGPSPYGFIFDSRDHLLVANEDAIVTRLILKGPSGASSYSVGADGTVTPITPFAVTPEFSACWMVLSADEKYTYATNAIGNGVRGSISSFAVGADGSLTVVNPTAGVINNPGAPGAVDEDTSTNERFIYALSVNAPPPFTTNVGINAFKINADGSLSPVQAFAGLMPGTSGLAAY